MSSSSTKSRVQLPEVIDERTDMVSLFGKPVPEVHVDCSNLKRINSMGVRSLKFAMRRMKLDGSKFALDGITPPLVEAMEFVSNLLPEGTKINSVFLPYACVPCKQNFSVLCDYKQLEKNQNDAETAPCPSCGKPAEFDHIPEIYFKALFDLDESA